MEGPRVFFFFLYSKYSHFSLPPQIKLFGLRLAFFSIVKS